MKTNLIFFFLILLSGFGISQKEYIINTDYRSSLVDIEIDMNGDYVAIMTADSLDYHFWGGLVKFDNDFNYEIFVHNIDTADFYLMDFVITENNHYLISGKIGKDDGIWYHTHTLYFLLVDENLNIISEHFLDMPENYDNPQIKMFQTADHRNYVMVHQQESGAVFKAYVELSDEGEVINQAFYNTSGMAMSAFKKPNSNNGFYILQESASPQAYAEIVDVDTNLNYSTTLLPLVVSGEIYQIGTRGSCKWLNDSVYILCTEGSYGLPDRELWLYKMSADHEYLSEPFIIGQENIKDNSLRHRGIDWVSTDRIYVASWYWPNMNFILPYYVAVLNKNFEVLGAKSIGSDSNNILISSLLATDNGGCVMVGGQRNIQGGNEYDWNGYVAFFSPDDIITTSVETANPYDSDYLIYPNPGTDEMVIQTTRKEVVLRMFNQTGKLVLKKNFQDIFRNKISTSALEKGIYICHLTDKYGNREIKKWIKQ